MRPSIAISKAGETWCGFFKNLLFPHFVTADIVGGAALA